MDEYNQENWEREEYTKENLDKLFYYGSKILEELQQSANEKDITLTNTKNDLQNAERRYENLRGDLKNILNRYQD